MDKKQHMCAAVDCDNALSGMLSSAKYCSNRCKWRHFAQKRRSARIAKGLCPQCGGDRDAIATTTYCNDCKKYYHLKYAEKQRI